MSTAQEITRRLIADFKFKETGDFLSAGKCPSCGEPEAYTFTEKPYTIICPRDNKCGQRTRVKDLYPDLFGNYNQRFRSTRAKPNATANAYLSMERGLDITKMEGWYTQGKYSNPNANKSTATVRFEIIPDVYMERFVETVTITDKETGTKDERKQNFKGKRSGHAWTPPQLKPDKNGEVYVDKGDEIWITEGILDAISLLQNGIKAIAALSSNTYPEKTLETFKGLGVKLVWALDNDVAGKRWMKTHAKRSREEGFETSCAYIPTKANAKDWNDLQIAKKYSDHMIAECRHHGDLLLAETSREKALLIHKRHNSPFFCFEFNSRTFGFELDREALNKAKSKLDDNPPQEAIDHLIFEYANIPEIANFAIEFQYFMSNEITEESWYSSLIRFPHKGSSRRCNLNGGQISSPPEFKKRVMSLAPGAVFTGKTAHLDWLTRLHLFGIKTVETVDFIGYSKEHNTYIFDQNAYSCGKEYKINTEEYFQLNNLSIRSLQKSINIHIGNEREYQQSWVDDIWIAFGNKGIIALSYWVGTLFAEQIRSKQSSFPFLEIVGMAGTGKTTLVELLWRLFGREDEEGFDPSKATAAASARKFTQVSNLPIVLIEADREEDAAKHRKFDWEETKPLYNGRGSRSRGVKNSGNETSDPPFRGALSVVQNDPVKASPAVMQRFLHIEFQQSEYSPETKDAADRLSLMQVGELSHFLRICLLNEQDILNTFFKAFEKYEKALLEMPEVKTVRIAKNHAQLMAMAQAVFPLINLDESKAASVRDEIKTMTIDRQHAIGGDHPVIENFWEIFDYLEGLGEGGKVVNHSRNSDKIAINLRHFAQVSSEHRQEAVNIDQLKKYLRQSKSRKFLEYKTVNSAIPRVNEQGYVMTGAKPMTLKCFVFDNPNNQGQ